MSFHVSSLTNTILVLRNMIVDSSEHRLFDMRPPHATLFLHEDLLAKTLQFERELKEWRLAELRAGRGDPGRPRYEYAFSTVCICSS